MESSRLINVLWQKYVEQGDYAVEDHTIANCSVCGRKQVECQILKSPNNPQPLNLCIVCLGGTD